jgi:hypothetical protein
MSLILLTAHFDSNGKALKQLVAPRADDVNTDDAFLWPDNHELEQRWLLVFRRDHGEVESPERRLVYDRSCQHKSSALINEHEQILTASPYFSRAWGSVRPTVPIGGWLRSGVDQ